MALITQLVNIANSNNQSQHNLTVNNSPSKVDTFSTGDEDPRGFTPNLGQELKGEEK